MEYLDFLEAVIERGITAAAESYADDPPKRDGAIAGFKICRGLAPAAIGELLREASARANRLGMGQIEPSSRSIRDNYWYARCYALEIEWVANLVSAVLMNEGKPTIIPPTARGVLAAAEILKESA